MQVSSMNLDEAILRHLSGSELSEQGDYSLYPEGSLWQDGSSRDKENMLNWYVRKNGEWVFGFRALAIDFFSPIYPKEKSNETQN